MTVTNLASIHHAVSLLSDRTITDAVADELRAALETATGLIAAHLDTTFTTNAQTKVYDIAPGFSDTPGAFATNFTKPYRPRFKLPVTGGIGSLTVKYRGDHAFEDGFSWADVEPLVEFRDYILRADVGDIELLFAPCGMPQGLHVQFTEGYASEADVLAGTRGTDHLMRLGVETPLAPLPALLTGVAHPRVVEAATAQGTAGVLASVVLAPPQPIAAHRVRLHAPQDQALAKSAQPLTLTLHGGPEGGMVQLSTANIASPLPGHTYVLEADPETPYSRYEVRISGGNDDEVAVGLLEAEFADPATRHMEGHAPEGLTTACALLATHLYRKSVRDGVGKASDNSGRQYTARTMPPEVLQLLRPYGRSHVSFV